VKIHRYVVTLKWTGNLGSGTSNYRSYSRNYEISSPGKPSINGSSDPAFRGDKNSWNPEELLVGSLAACHKLWFLHLCATSGIVVIDYVDCAEGFMEESSDGSGRFQKVILKPEVTLAPGSDSSKAMKLHDEAHEKCFIANSVNFPVTHEAQIKIANHP
jgi:organic hydroperoxide reductase OsmC/OhrA